MKKCLCALRSGRAFECSTVFPNGYPRSGPNRRNDFRVPFSRPRQRKNEPQKRREALQVDHRCGQVRLDGDVPEMPPDRAPQSVLSLALAVNPFDTPPVPLVSPPIYLAPASVSASRSQERFVGFPDQHSPRQPPADERPILSCFRPSGYCGERSGRNSYFFPGVKTRRISI